ncbi:MAG TPA: lipopolysaccharide biosynthesis protein [Acidimicrobiales bacterium]|nr:lipopolysaccharide biosynthesis protein [Acidimicrobiales bacterium]
MSDPSQLPDAKGDRLVRTTSALVISNGTSAVLGVAFWTVAARVFSAKDVGYGAAEVSAMTVVSSFAFLNLGTIFPRFLYPAGARAGQVLKAGYAASLSIGLVASIVFLVLPIRHDYIEPGLAPRVFFVVAVLLWIVFTIEDSALVGLRSTFWVPVENTSFSIAKIALLPVFVIVAPRAGVFTSWVLPVVGCVIAINLYLWRRVLPQHVRASEGLGTLPRRSVIGRVLAGEYAGGLSFAAMVSLPQLFVEAKMGSKQVAYFQTPWLAATSFDLLLFSFATSLIVEASARPSAAPTSVRRSARLALIVMVPGMVALVVGAPWLLRILGTAYAANGTRLLQLVALAFPFMCVNVLYVTYARLARRVRRVFAVQFVIAAEVLALTWVLLKPLGLAGAGVAYLGAQGVTALVLLPSVVRQYRDPQMASGHAPDAVLVAPNLDGVVATSTELKGAGEPPMLPEADAGGAWWRRRRPAGPHRRRPS